MILLHEILSYSRSFVDLKSKRANGTKYFLTFIRRGSERFARRETNADTILVAIETTRNQMLTDARELFGEIDIYLFDQILKNQFTAQMSILDAGCGGGRNLVYFLRGGCRVFGVDRNPEAIEYVRSLAKTLAPQLAADNFQISEVETMPFSSEHFDAVISNAVLHFADDELHFDRMLNEMWRVLKPHGLFFARLASGIGIEDKIELIEDRRYFLPDGSERFLVDEELLRRTTERLGGILAEPLKTTNVQNLRSMTTWVLRKTAADLE